MGLRSENESRRLALGTAGSFALWPVEFMSPRSLSVVVKLTQVIKREPGREIDRMQESDRQTDRVRDILRQGEKTSGIE